MIDCSHAYPKYRHPLQISSIVVMAVDIRALRIVLRASIVVDVDLLDEGKAEDKHHAVVRVGVDHGQQYCTESAL